MRTEIRIDMNNAAFADSPSDELARILRNLANEIRRGGDFVDIGPDGNGYKSLRDYNGNTVGVFTILDNQWTCGDCGRVWNYGNDNPADGRCICGEVQS